MSIHEYGISSESIDFIKNYRNRKTDLLTEVLTRLLVAIFKARNITILCKFRKHLTVGAFLFPYSNPGNTMPDNKH